MYKILIALLVLIGLFTSYQYLQVKKLKKENVILSGNNNTLLDSVVKYKTSDSLNAASVGDLNLTLEQFERYRSDDARLIASLQTDKRQLQSVSTAHTRTISELTGRLRDSIIIRRIDPPDPAGAIVYITDTIKCLDISEKWFSLSGCIDRDNFKGKHVSRDSLLIAVTAQYRRFWGFLWKTNKIKNRKVDVVSRNPDTEILGIEFIEIIK